MGRSVHRGHPGWKDPAQVRLREEEARRGRGAGRGPERQGEGLLLDAGSTNVAEFLADWMGSEKESVQGFTQARRELVLRLHVIFDIGHLRLSKLNALHVQMLCAAKLDEGMSPGTVRLIHVNLSKALQKAVRGRLVCANVARSATAPKNSADEVNPSTSEEDKRQLDAARGTGSRPCTFWS